MVLRIANLVVCVIALTTGCFSAQQRHDINVAQYSMAARFHEAASYVEARLARGERISVTELYVLCDAYYQLRRYRDLFAQLETFERRIASGDAESLDLDGGRKDLFGFPALYRARAYLDLGQFDRSIAEVTAALPQIRGRSPDQQRIDAHGTRGLAYALTGDKTKATAELDALGRVRADMREPQKLAAIARIHMALRNYPAAYTAITDPRIGSGASAGRARRFAAKVTGVQLSGTFQDLPRTFIEAKCLYETGRLADAERQYKELLRHPSIDQFGGIYWIILFDLAQMSQRRGELGPAIELLAKSADVIDSQRSSIDTELGRIGFVGDKQAVYAELVRLLAAQKRAPDAFEVVERSKGRALVDLLASRGNVRVELRTSEPNKALVRELDVAEQTAAVVAPGDSSTQRGLVRTRVATLARAQPELASLVAVPRVTPASIQARLRDDETLLEYYLSGRELYTFVVTRTSVTVNVTTVTDLVATVTSFRAALANRRSADHQQWSARLHAMLIAPVATQLRTDRLVIVPHGVLHYVPFAALAADNTPLIDHHTIRTLPSASVLLYLPDVGTRDLRTALVLGNPDRGDTSLDLPFAEDEARAILGNVTKELRLRERAGEAFVKQRARDYDILHFATHGVFDTKQPLQSALLLVGGGGDDGLLTVGELFSVSMPARLVTLSACETALGDVTNGDEVVGFTRALLYAGARTIVASLWKVDDLATRDLMVAFYARLLSSDRETALRQAQRTIRDTYPHPYFWAGFQIYGDRL